MRLRAAITVMLGIGAVTLASSPMAEAADFTLPPVQRGANLGDCTAKLEAQGGGWCEIRLPGEHPSISSVWPQGLKRRTRMIVGPRAILSAWNGAAFDRDNLLLYFTGGGHADYGGNEVYEFDLKNGRWTRLNDPSPLTFLALSQKAKADKPAVYCWVPDLLSVPPATHTYDGIQFSHKTKTIFLVVHGGADGSCFRDKEKEIDEADPKVFDRRMGSGFYEFNPAREETRNGLEPLTWRRLDLPEGFRTNHPRSLELPDGAMMIGSKTELFMFDPVARKVGKRVWREGDGGDGIAEYHPDGMVFSLHHRKLLARSMKSGAVKRFGVPVSMLKKSLTFDKDGVGFSWNGTARVLTFDPSAPDSERAWRLYDWSRAGPTVGKRKVYSKWQYLPEQDAFVGISTYKTGVWIYKHPKAMPAIEISSFDPQRLIDRAPQGAVVTIPPGLYGQGLEIRQSLTVKLKDAQFWGVARGKGIINVNCNGCSVVIEDFRGVGRESGCLGGNCAGIKAEGKNFTLTVRRAHIDNTVMGILTDNRGGTLIVEDSHIENTGLNDFSKTLGHGLYAGEIDRLELRRTTIRNVNSDGHILKSRAKDNVLDEVRLLGGHGYHSRSIDFPCGGKLQIAGSIIQHSENTDNSDLISVGTEHRGCDTILPSSVSITDSWIIFDRDRSADERSRKHGPNSLFRWRAPMTAVELTDNHIVNLDKWSTSDAKKGDVTISDQSAGNTVCETRAACGLEADQLPQL